MLWLGLAWCKGGTEGGTEGGKGKPRANKQQQFLEHSAAARV